MAVEAFRLGVDFGTSNTVAVLAWPDGRVKPLLFDGSPLLPSAVYADPGGGLLVGRDALHAARARPECFEPNPKRRVDDGVVLLGEVEVPVVDLVAAVLRRVAGEAGRITGAPVPVTLTCPVGWGLLRRKLLLAAAAAAGLAGPDVVAEPVAAASYFVEVVGTRVPVGSCAVVYDFGAGTFDASVVRRTGDGFEVLASEGLPDVGGLDIDAAVVAYLGAVHTAGDGDTWRRLVEPVTPAERRANRLLWEDVRAGKEMLSRAGSTLLYLPLIDADAPLGREQLEQLARPILDRTVAATVAALRHAGTATTAVAGLFLVGGSSRIPLVATLLHRAFGVPPTVIEQPELVVAEGSLRTRPQPTAPVARAAVTDTDTRPALSPPAASVPAAPPPASPSPSPTTAVRGPRPPPVTVAQTTAPAAGEHTSSAVPPTDVSGKWSAPPPPDDAPEHRDRDRVPGVDHAAASDLSQEVGASGAAARGRPDRPALLVAVGVLWLVTLYLPTYPQPGLNDRPINHADGWGIPLLLGAGIAAAGIGLYRGRRPGGRPSLAVAIVLNTVVLFLSVALAVWIPSADEGFGTAGFGALLTLCLALAYLVTILVARRTV